MGRVAPNKPSKCRRNENAINSGSASTTQEDETPPQTPAANGASSTDGETPRSTLVIPTRAERKLTILAPLWDSFPTLRGDTSSQAEAEINGNISLPVDIMQQLQEFFQKQEAFNARVEESLQQRVEETGKRRQTRRLPNAVMVSSLFFAIVVVTSNVYSFCGIFTLLKFSAKTISSSCREVRGSGGWKLNYGYCFQNCEYSKISETSGNSDSVSTQVAGLTLVTRALATCTCERARRRRDSLNV